LEGWRILDPLEHTQLLTPIAKPDSSRCKIASSPPPTWACPKLNFPNSLNPGNFHYYIGMNA